MKDVDRKHTVAFVASASGGHIIPGTTYAQQLLNEGRAQNILFFTANRLFDRELLALHAPEASCTQVHVSWFGIPYTRPWLLPYWILVCARTIIQSLTILKKHRPTRLVSMGGALSIPVCLAAKLLRIPIELVELNVEPGRAVGLLAPLAHRIDICFTQTRSLLRAQPSRVRIMPYPIRFSRAQTNLTPAHARAQIGLDPHKKTLLILGGSQGSVQLNQLVVHWLERTPRLATTVQVIHQTGNDTSVNWQKFYAKRGIQALTFSYKDNIAQHYCAADLIICRSGAGTLAETEFFGKPAITIPLEAATTTHQVRNAWAAASRNPTLFTVLTHSELKRAPGLFGALIHQQLNNHTFLSTAHQVHLHPSQSNQLQAEHPE